MIDYIIEESTDKEYKYVVWRVNEKDNGSCWRSVYHSNNKAKCERFISKERKKDLDNEKSLSQQPNDIENRKHILLEKYKERIKYVKKYNKKEPYYD